MSGYVMAVCATWLPSATLLVVLQTECVGSTGTPRCILRLWAGGIVPILSYGLYVLLQLTLLWSSLCLYVLYINSEGTSLDFGAVEMFRMFSDKEVTCEKHVQEGWCYVTNKRTIRTCGVSTSSFILCIVFWVSFTLFQYLADFWTDSKQKPNSPECIS